MISTVEKFTKEYNYHMKTIRVLPFKSAKYTVLKTVYRFYMQYSEIIRMIDNDKLNEDLKIIHRQYLSNVHTQLKEHVKKIMQAEDINALATNLENLFTGVILQLNGYIRLYGNTFSLPLYSCNYNGVENEVDAKNELVKTAIEQLDFKRKDINVITILGAKDGYGSLVHEGCLDTLLNVPTWFKNNTVNNYVLVDEESTHRRILNTYGYNSLYKKLIYGTFEEVRTSTNFDMGFMGCQSLYGYFNKSSEDEVENILIKMAELRSKVAKGGVMFLLFPRIFLTVPVLENIFSYMRNINIFIGGKTNAYVLVVGTRKLLRDKKIDGIIELMQHIAFGENLRNPIDLECLPMAEVRFRSVTPSRDEVEEVIGANTVFLHNFFDKATKNMELKTEEEVRHPLIPFGPGQLGLVLVSGKIDGIVDEGDGVYHVIKGSARVETNIHDAMTTSMERTVETVTSTGVSVAILTASGQYVQLV